MAEDSSNPVGFSERLRLLMVGFGFEGTRPLAERAGVSHGTIANWLNGKGRASLDEVEKVARVFGWTVGELYHGTPAPEVMTRVAELEAFRSKAMRLASQIAEDDVPSKSSTAGYAPAVTNAGARRRTK